MNFLRNFLQGKEDPSNKTCGKSLIKDGSVPINNYNTHSSSIRRSDDQSTYEINQPLDAGNNGLIVSSPNACSLPESNTNTTKFLNKDLYVEEGIFLEKPLESPSNQLSSDLTKEKETTQSEVATQDSASISEFKSNEFFDCEENLVPQNNGKKSEVPLTSKPFLELEANEDASVTKNFSREHNVPFSLDDCSKDLNVNLEKQAAGKLGTVIKDSEGFEKVAVNSFKCAQSQQLQSTSSELSLSKDLPNVNGESSPSININKSEEEKPGTEIELDKEFVISTSEIVKDLENPENLAKTFESADSQCPTNLLFEEFNKKSDTEASLESLHKPAEVKSTSHLEIVDSKSNPEDKGSYLEFVFDDPKKPLKSPPKNLGKRNKNKNSSNNKKNPQKLTPSTKVKTTKPQTKKDNAHDIPVNSQSSKPVSNGKSQKGVAETCSNDTNKSDQPIVRKSIEEPFPAPPASSDSIETLLPKTCINHRGPEYSAVDVVQETGLNNENKPDTISESSAILNSGVKPQESSEPISVDNNSDNPQILFVSYPTNYSQEVVPTSVTSEGPCEANEDLEVTNLKSEVVQSSSNTKSVGDEILDKTTHKDSKTEFFDENKFTENKVNLKEPEILDKQADPLFTLSSEKPLQLIDIKPSAVNNTTEIVEPESGIEKSLNPGVINLVEESVVTQTSTNQPQETENLGKKAIFSLQVPNQELLEPINTKVSVPNSTTDDPSSVLNKALNQDILDLTEARVVNDYSAKLSGLNNIDNSPKVLESEESDQSADITEVVKSETHPNKDLLEVAKSENISRDNPEQLKFEFEGDKSCSLQCSLPNPVKEEHYLNTSSPKQVFAALKIEENSLNQTNEVVPQLKTCSSSEKLPGNSNIVKVEEGIKSLTNSVQSISCYGNEEFEILGNEANKLAEEIYNINPLTASTTSVVKMEETTSTEDVSANLESLALKGSKKRGKGISKKDSLSLQVGDSEAGPDIATGLTSSDLKCASEFFREAAELESQIRRNISSSAGSYADFGSEGDRSSYGSESGSYTSLLKGAPISSPPNEERSAPEGTCSPDPKSLEDSEVRNRLQRSPNCSLSPEVNELLKKQALEFEEKLLRQGIVAAEKEKELHEMLKEEQKHMQKVTASRDALLRLVEQYKGMLAALVGEKEKANSLSEEKVKTLESEKQQAIEDLSNVEAAFSDVHRKYERTKQIVDSLRRNEETLRTAVDDYEQKLAKQEKKFVELQKHAEEKVKLANEEFEALRRSNDQEMTKMGALLKKAEMKIISLQESLERKTRENQELTQLCDDLINKVGS